MHELLGVLRYYALYCEEKISPLLGIRIPHLESQH